MRRQFIIHARFAMDFLQAHQMISPSAELQNFASGIACLFDCEPGIFALTEVLASGLLHDYLEDMKRLVEKEDRGTHMTVRLCGVLAWFLQRRGLPRSLANPPPRPPSRKRVLHSPNCPRLQPLPDAIIGFVEEYNSRTFDIYCKFVRQVANEGFEDADFQLPLTQRQCLREFPLGAPPVSENGPFAQAVKESRAKYKARSPFAALGGSTDHFENLADLVDSRRRSFVHIDYDTVPMVPIDQPLNSMLVDVLYHKSDRKMAQENHLTPGEVYAVKAGFKRTLEVLGMILGKVSPPNDIVLLTMQELLHDMPS